ncbi:MAG: insulinase family protein, partial [Vicinamibacteria bacterium]|nr:insulinase family protein [Vicinamibacteria bacterium]
MSINRNLRPQLLFSFVFAAAASLAAAQTEAPPATAKERPPSPAPPRDFSVATPKDFVLDNGLSVTLVNYGSTPKIDLGLYVAAGNSYESAGEVWLGDLTAQLMREGTAAMTGPQISRAAAQMGGQVDLQVGADTAVVTGSSLSEFAPDLVKLVADLTLNPKFPQGELERLKADNLRRLSLAKSN